MPKEDKPDPVEVTLELQKNFPQQFQPPNEISNGRLLLVRCYVCDPFRGKVNWAMNVASGMCTWCGWPTKGMKDVVANLNSMREKMMDNSDREEQ